MGRRSERKRFKGKSVLGCAVVAVFLFAGSQAWAQQVRQPAPQELSAALQTALSGEWTGVLEYRDYSEPATSTKREKLPTWLNVTPQDASLRFLYTYDDGPAKTVVDAEMVSIDVGSSRWTTQPEAVAPSKEKAEVASIAGLSNLKDGRGTLVLTGPGHGERQTGGGPNDDARWAEHFGDTVRDTRARRRVHISPCVYVCPRESAAGQDDPGGLNPCRSLR